MAANKFSKHWCHPARSPYRHELNREGTSCATDCPACRWSKQHSHLRLFIVLAFLLLAVLPSVGQMANNYSGSHSVEFVSNYSQCGSGVAVSHCWASIAGAPVLSNVSVGADGDMWGVTTTSTTGGYTVVHYSTSSRTWQTINGGLVQIALSDAGHVYGRNNAGYLYRFNGSSFSYTYGQGHSISVSIEGDLYTPGMTTRGCGYGIYKYSGSSGSWADTGLAGTQVSAVNASSIWLLCGSGSGGIFHWTSGGGLQNIPGGLASITAMYDDVNVLGIGGGNTIFHLDTTGGNTAFSVVTGNPQALSAAHQGVVFGVFAGGALQQFSAYSLRLYQTVSGSASCDIPNCPISTTQHTGTAIVQIQGHAQKRISGSVNYGSYLSVTARDDMSPLESLACLNPYYVLGNFTPSCPSVFLGGGVQCPIMGALPVAGTTLTGSYWPSFPRVEIAMTRVIYNGMAPINCITSKTGNQCDIPVHPWCSNTPTPDYDPPFVRDYTVSTYNLQPVWTAWNAWALCVRPSLMGQDMGWLCQSGNKPFSAEIAIEVARYGYTPPQALCTYNP
jgi:Tectonin domain